MKSSVIQLVDSSRCFWTLLRPKNLSEEFFEFAYKSSIYGPLSISF